MTNREKNQNPENLNKRSKLEALIHEQRIAEINAKIETANSAFFSAKKPTTQGDK